MSDAPRRAMSARALPVGAIGYMINTERGPVAVLSADWGVETVAEAAESMYNALHGDQQPNPTTRAHIRNVS